jgi:hypothetical protein
MTFRLYLPDTCPYLSHATSELVDRETLDIKAFHDVCFASHMVHWAFARERSKDIKLSDVGWARNCVTAHRRQRIALRHSSVHHGTAVQRGTVDDRGIFCEAGRSKALVKYSTIESKNRKVLVLKNKDWEKTDQSPRPVINFGGLNTVGDGADTCKLTG